MTGPAAPRTARLRSRAASEEGFALAVTIMVMTIGLALASVGSIAAMSSMRNAERDGESKRALAVAEAGVQQALLRQNKIATTDAAPCIVLGAASGLIAGFPLANGWCPEIDGAVDDGTFTYTVRPPTLIGTLQGEQRVTFVAEGTVGETTRRIWLDAIASTGYPAFADASVIGLDRLELNGTGRIAGSVGTNADLVINGQAEVCGDIHHGMGRAVINNGTGGGQCSGFIVTEKTTALSPPDPGNVATENDNGRFFTQDTKTGSVTWNATTRTLTMTGNSSLTLGGSNYSLCRLQMSGNSNIFVANGAVARIWFDSPESCGQTSSYEQLSMTGNSEISVTAGDAGDAGLIFVGSHTTASTVRLAGNGRANEFFLYAPLSDVSISGNGNYTGGIAGETVVSDGNGTITAHESVLDFEVGVQTAWEAERFLECSGPLESDPAQGCT